MADLTPLRLSANPRGEFGFHPKWVLDDLCASMLGQGVPRQVWKALKVVEGAPGDGPAALRRSGRWLLGYLERGGSGYEYLLDGVLYARGHGRKYSVDETREQGGYGKVDIATWTRAHDPEAAHRIRAAMVDHAFDNTERGPFMSGKFVPVNLNTRVHWLNPPEPLKGVGDPSYAQLYPFLHLAQVADTFEQNSSVDQYEDACAGVVHMARLVLHTQMFPD